MPAFPDVRSLVPHAGSACLLSAVVRSGPESTECRALLSPEHPYVETKSAHSLLAIELFAQTAAVHRALSSAGEHGGGRSGHLASANLTLRAARLPVPAVLLVRVRPELAHGNLQRFVGQLFVEGEQPTLVAEGDVSVALGEPSPAPKRLS